MPRQKRALTTQEMLNDITHRLRLLEARTAFPAGWDLDVRSDGAIVLTNTDTEATYVFVPD